ncbi:hypothetical protein [Actinomadura litoris]|uniref:Uncharacterized protein n=1 Tax=Actinomadura litoris TaxID=2678616 RepID=A0A7K1LAD8_9ACTN|nr:hypothetical protein [Actinomadura litoris]MUN41390.1 hypothetical protein [Actinomadura litoris]
MSEEWTAQQCATEWGVQLKTWHSYVARGQAPGSARHSGRTPLWEAETVRAWPRPGQGARNDLNMPDELPVLYETTVGTRGDMSGSTSPLPRYWHVSVADRAARGDTYLEVMRPDGQTVACVAWHERLNEGSDELAEAVAWITGAARKVWAAGAKLAQGTPPAVLWADVADAWEFAGRNAYFAWAKEIVASGVTRTAYL